MGMASYIMTTSDKNNPEFKDLYLFHGKSAYQAAVEQGYEGTEEEWIWSLRELRFGKSGFTDKNSLLIYIDTANNVIYRYDEESSKYVYISRDLGETSETAYRGDRGKTAYEHAIAEHPYLPLAGGDMSGDIKSENILPSITNAYSIGSSTLVYAGIYATTFYGALSGNASTASSLATARNLTISDGTNSGTATSFDGSGNVILNLPKTIKATFVGNITGDVTGNADTATTLKTARTIAISGKATGTATSFNGSKDISIPITAIDPTGITQSESYRFVTDSQISAWNAKPTQAEMTAALSALIDAAPGTLDTLNELAAALGDDPNFATTMTNELATKLPLAGGTMTGDINSMNILPKATTTYTLGSSSYKFKAVYATTFYGSLSGTANYAYELYTARNLTISDGTNSGTATSFDGSGNVTLNLPKTIKATITGNADTATTLKTARTINGTSFDGSDNITTELWGTARNLTIGNTAKSVNGSAAVSWTLAEIGAIPLAGTSSLSGSIVPNTKATLALGSSTYKFKAVYASYFYGYLSGTATYANSAVSLSTARTLTIGNTGKSFDGSEDVSWSLDEIGAYSSGGGTVSGNMTVTGTITCNSTITGTKVYNAIWNDYAEYFEKENADDEFEPGEIVAWEENGVVKADIVHRDMVVGVVSNTFGHIVGGEEPPKNYKGTYEEYNSKKYVALGLAGRVSVKVKGYINKGDLITASDIPGVGMAAPWESDYKGCIVGKALGDKETEGVGYVKMLIMLR